MISTAFTRTTRAVLAALFLLAPTLAHALESSAVFSYTDAAHATQLELTTNTGVHLLVATARGWVSPVNVNNGALVDNNYIAGLCGSSDSCDGLNVEFRNWFAFSLVTTAFSSILSANLLLDVPAAAPGEQGVYASLGNPIYTVWDVTQPAAIFTGGGAGAAEFNDLGSGTVYGSRVYTLADQGAMTTSIALNAAAITFLNANLQQTVVLGGAVTPIPVATPAAVPTAHSASLAVMGALLALFAFLALRRRARV
ncbi:MAG: hypothetical protein IT520_20995 [Burkholderiales bacterium]|nr:hypothetical protein [Burkholderiales bacterium]